MKDLLNLVSVRVSEMEPGLIKKETTLDGWLCRNAVYRAPGDYEFLQDDWRQLNVGDIWARAGETAFLRRVITVPSDWAGERVGLDLMTGGEGLLTVDGKPLHGVDDMRGYILLAAEAKGGETFDCEIEIRTGGYWEYLADDLRRPYILSKAKLIAVDREIEPAYYDFKVALEGAQAEEDPILQESILRAVKTALQAVDFRDKSGPAYRTGLESARGLLREKLEAIDARQPARQGLFCRSLSHRCGHGFGRSRRPRARLGGRTRPWLR